MIDRVTQKVHAHSHQISWWACLISSRPSYDKSLVESTFKLFLLCLVSCYALNCVHPSASLCLCTLVLLELFKQDGADTPCKELPNIVVHVPMLFPFSPGVHIYVIPLTLRALQASACRGAAPWQMRDWLLWLQWQAWLLSTCKTASFCRERGLAHGRACPLSPPLAFRMLAGKFKPGPTWTPVLQPFTQPSDAAILLAENRPCHMLFRQFCNITQT